MLALTDALLAHILRLCPGLRQLDVSRCPQLTDAAVEAIARTSRGEAGTGGSRSSSGGSGGSGLNSLSLAGYWQIGSVALLRSCPGLTSPSLDGCWRLESGGVRQVGCRRRRCFPTMCLCAPMCTGLFSRLSSYALFSLAELLCLLQWRACLRALRQPACPLCVLQVLSALPRLESLSLSGCAQLDSAVLVSRPGPAPAAAGGHGPGVPGPEEGLEGGEEEDEGEEEEEILGAARHGGGGQPLAPPGAPRLPLEGVALPRLRSLDVGGTAVDNGLLFWLALRCCAQLQRLAVAGCMNVDGECRAWDSAAQHSIAGLAGTSWVWSGMPYARTVARGCHRWALHYGGNPCIIALINVFLRLPCCSVCAAGLGIGAVLTAKRLLLEAVAASRGPCPMPASEPPSSGPAAPCGAGGTAWEVLPLLELNAGGLPRWAPANAEQDLGEWWAEQQVR